MKSMLPIRLKPGGQSPPGRPVGIYSTCSPTRRNLGNNDPNGRRWWPVLLMVVACSLSLLTPLKLAAFTIVQVQNNGGCRPQEFSGTVFVLEAYSDDGSVAPIFANDFVDITGPDAASGALTVDKFKVGEGALRTEYPLAGNEIVRMPVRGKGNSKSKDELLKPLAVTDLDKSTSVGDPATLEAIGTALINPSPIGGKLPPFMGASALVRIAGGHSAAKSVDPAIIPIGSYNDYNPSVTNVSISVDRFGSIGIFDAAFNDTQDTNSPVWSLSIDCTNATTSPNVLQVTFNNDPNRLLIVDSNNPYASYATLTSEIASAIIAQFTLASNTLSADSLTIFTNGTYLVTQPDTYASDSIDAAATEAPAPPAASPMIVTRTAGLSVKIALPDIATNWSDVAGYPVELTAINFTSTNGQPVYPLNLQTNLDGSYVISGTAFLGYVNVANVNDQLSYTITDSLGGTTTGLIDIVVSTSPLFGQITGIINPGGQSVRLNFAGDPGYTYNVQRSTDLINWTTIATITAPAAGPFTCTDTFGNLGGIAPASAYYRLSWNPLNP
jgi:hypothetical protein